MFSLPVYLSPVQGFLIMALLLLARGAAVILLRVPAPGRLIENGFERAHREREAATFHGERAPKPWRVDDFIAFQPAGGEEIRATVSRWAVPHSSILLVWHRPGRPERFTTVGPLTWFGWALACLGTAAWLHWG